MAFTYTATPANLRYLGSSTEDTTQKQPATGNTPMWWHWLDINERICRILQLYAETHTTHDGWLEMSLDEWLDTAALCRDPHNPWWMVGNVTGWMVGYCSFMQRPIQPMMDGWKCHWMNGWILQLYAETHTTHDGWLDMSLDEWLDTAALCRDPHNPWWMVGHVTGWMVGYCSFMQRPIQPMMDGWTCHWMNGWILQLYVETHTTHDGWLEMSLDEWLDTAALCRDPYNPWWMVGHVTGWMVGYCSFM